MFDNINLIVKSEKGVVTVYGEEMTPHYLPGDRIALKKFNNLNFILWGKTYLILLNEERNGYRLLRRVFQHKDNDKLILRTSDPGKYSDLIVDKKDIDGLFMVTALMRINSY